MMKWLTLCLMVLAVAGCGSEDWRTRSLEGLMPPLEFELVDGQGERITEDSFEGRVTLMFFGYTFCPDICPVTLAKLSAVVDRLPEDVARDVRVLFISVDPERDDPQRLAAYTGAFGDFITGATGSQGALRELNRRYRATYGYSEPDEHGNYLVSHSSAVYVFDRDRETRLMFRLEDDIDDMAADLRQLAG